MSTDKPAGFRSGLYQDMPAEAYHADPLVAHGTMSLSSSGARTLLAECPAQWRWERDNRVQKREFDLGTAGHLIVLEPHLFEARTIVVRGKTKDGKEAAGYTTADAREQRDAAYQAGKVPLLPAEVDALHAMRAELFAHPLARHAFTGGQAEPSIFWQDREFGIWRRSRPDYRAGHGRYRLDYKTSTSANPDQFERQMVDLGYHMQAAWIMDAEEMLTGTRPDRFFFVVQARKAPFLVSVHEVDADALEWGRVQNRKAIGDFAWCLDHGTWPPYSPDLLAVRSFTARLPGWAAGRLEKMHEAGAFVPPQELAAPAQEAA